MTDTERIKEQLDIVDFLGRYIKVSQAGTNFKACCPFHNEKTASFMISRDRQVWHCFGCGKGGDIFTFIQEIENMEFPEAIKFLADLAGVQLDTSSGSMTKNNEKLRLKEIAEQAAHFYNQFLVQIDASKDARAYLAQRGLTEDTIQKWKIGYVPEQWDLLTKYITKKGGSIDDLVAAGLTIKKANASVQSNRGFYDRFRGRIMFPIRDQHGAVVGFTGRQLIEDSEKGGKYINSPQTKIYDKSKILFGLYFAKKAIRDTGRVVVVEGQMDVISSHQAGVSEVVASSGTALTAEQIKLLKRYTNTLLLCFDADAAGQQAAIRGIDEALSQGCTVKIVTIPAGAGKDPDDCIKNDPALWKQALDDAADVMQWFLDTAFAGKSLHNPQDKQEIVDRVLPRVAAISQVMIREHWLAVLAGRLGVHVDVFRQEMKKIVNNSQQDNHRGHSAVQSTQIETNQEKAQELTQFESKLERILLFVLHNPDLFGQVKHSLDDDVWNGTPFEKLYESIKLVYTNGAFTIDQIREYLSDKQQLSAQLDILLLKTSQEIYDMQASDITEEMSWLIQYIKKLWIQSELQRLQQQLIVAGQKQDIETEKALLLQVKKLQQDL